MAIVIHTRKGKYRYAYEHIREGDKVVSRYMYPVNDKSDKIKQYQKRVAQQPEQKEVAQQPVSISRIFCDKCKKPFYYQTSIMNKGITVYRNNGIITGYSFKHKRPIKKISCVSGVSVEKEVYTLKFYCKKCYNKIAQQPEQKEVAQQTNIDTEIEEMEIYAALHTKKVRKKHTFKKCPVCGSTNIRIIDLRPLGHKNSSQCRECGHTL